MQATITASGDLSLPAALRDELGLKPGTLLKVHSQDGRLIAERETYADVLRRWRGRGQLRVGTSVDEYLKLVRDGDSR
jgi:AbrB family looped-hinge helix DNA binding protein